MDQGIFVRLIAQKRTIKPPESERYSAKRSKIQVYEIKCIPVIDDERGSGSCGAAVELNHVPLLGHDTNKSEHTLTFIFILMLAE